MRKFVLSVFALTSILLYPSHAIAANNYSTSFISTYQVTPVGTTHVTHQIDITNQVPHAYLTKYTISLGSDTIQSLRVTSQGQKIAFTEQKNGPVTDLSFNIPHPVIGKDQQLNLQIAYETTSIATRYGDIWEINIPRLSRANEASYYKRQIIVPPSLGEPRVATPKASMMSQDEEGIRLEYVGFPNNSISLLFGESLTYELNLTYHLSNKFPSSTDTELALPPDTEYQRVLVGELSPPPQSIKLDVDGNWLAVYPLKASSQQEIKAKLFVTLHPQPQYKITMPTDLTALTKPTKYWDTKSTSITTLAHKLTTPEQIYNYLVENLSYDFSKIGQGADRLGGSKALNNPGSAICTEFTDSFVTLARAAGIEAREINGYAYNTGSNLKTTNQIDMLHAWPEYYDRANQTWVAIDPTLGQTSGLDYFNKLDFGHLTFVRHGLEDSYPYPAGTYKSDPTEKTISIDPVHEIPQIVDKLEIKEQDKAYLIQNLGNVAIHDKQINLPDGSKTTIAYLPPYGEYRYDFHTPQATFHKFFEKLTVRLQSLLSRLLPLHSNS